MNSWTKTKIKMSFVAFIGITLDQFTKYYVRTNHTQFDSSVISISYYKNHGFALGALSSVGGNNTALFSGLLYCVIASFLIILLFGLLKSDRYNKIRYGLLFFLIGISGNAFDKIISGFVTDFLILKFPPFNRLVINIADIYLLTGTFIISLISLFFTANIWFEGNRRKQLLVEKDFQYDYAIRNIFIICIPLFFSNLITIALLRFFNIQISIQFILWATAAQFLFLLFLGATIFIYGLIESNKISGPLFAYKRALLKKQNRIQFREGDYHQELLKECLAKQHHTSEVNDDIESKKDFK